MVNGLSNHNSRDLGKIKKTNKKRQEKIDRWQQDMRSILPIWGDTSSLLQEDAEFLEDQKTSRLV